jgi:hypothetical protein
MGTGADEASRETNTAHSLEGSSMGRLNIGAVVYGMDTIIPSLWLELHHCGAD